MRPARLRRGKPRIVDQLRMAQRREEPPPSGWGVSGFTNNPFAKLKPGDDKKQ